MGLDEGLAGFLTNVFISLNYVFSLIGGIIADEFLGKIKTINISVWLFSIALLVTTTFSGLGMYFPSLSWGVFVGLFLVAVANGFLIPCISAFIGDQFLPHQV